MKWAVKFVGLFVILSISPALGLWGTSFAKKSLQAVYDDIVKNGHKVQTPNGPVVLTGFPDISLDTLCGGTEGSKESLCGLYRAVSAAHMSAFTGLVLTPLIPLLISLALIISEKRRRKRSPVSNVFVGTIMKSLDKIIGLHSAATGFALWAITYALGLGAILAAIIGVVIWLLLFLVEMWAVEMYTGNRVSLEAEIEPNRNGE